MFDLVTFDFIFIGIILVSTIWASIRGGVYETVATLSWVVAAVTARFVSPFLDSTFQGWFGLSESTIGTLIAAYFIVFFVILLGFGFINQRLRDRVQDSMMKITDHTLGIVFGIIRGVVIMGLLYWMMLWYYAGDKLPNYIADARTRPVMQVTAVKIHQWFIPGRNRLLEQDVENSAPDKMIFDNLKDQESEHVDEKPLNLEPVKVIEVDKAKPKEEPTPRPHPQRQNTDGAYDENLRNELQEQLKKLEI